MVDKESIFGTENNAYVSRHLVDKKKVNGGIIFSGEQQL